MRTLTWFTFLCLTGSLAVAAPPIRFAGAANYAINDYVNELAVGDFTNDGNPDIALVTGPGGNLAILPGGPTGIFGALESLTTDYYIAEVITLANLNADKLPDLVVAGSHNLDGGPPYGLQAFLDQTNGTLAGEPYTSLPYTIKTMTSGRFTNAGNADVVLVVIQPSGANGVMVLPSNGDGTFGPEQFTQIPDSEPFRVVARDFNGDGNLDLAVTDSSAPGVWILLGEGNGHFQTPVRIPLSQKTDAIAAADLNGDGKADLVATGASDLFSLLGNGDGTFQAPQAFPAGDLPRSLVVRDLNCDGIPDVATANFNGTGLSILQGNGDGTFGAPQLLAAGTEPVWIVSGDFNHDGRPDLAVANYISMSVSVYLNTTPANPKGCER